MSPLLIGHGPRRASELVCAAAGIEKHSGGIGKLTSFIQPVVTWLQPVARSITNMKYIHTYIHRQQKDSQTLMNNSNIFMGRSEIMPYECSLGTDEMTVETLNDNPRPFAEWHAP
jgi:hypothetical protein